MRGCVRGVLPRSTARGPVRGLVVIDVGRVCDGRGRGGTAAPTARDLVVVDAGVVRLLLEGLGLTSALDGRDCLRAVNGRLSAPRLLARGSVRGVLPRSTARGPICGLIVIDIGLVGDGRGRGGTAAPAARDLVIVDAGRVGDCRGTTAPAVLGLVVVDVAASATVVAMVGRRRPPLATSSSLTPASSTSSLRVSASRLPLMAATAFVQSMAASPLLAFL